MPPHPTSAAVTATLDGKPATACEKIETKFEQYEKLATIDYTGNSFTVVSHQCGHKGACEFKDEGSGHKMGLAGIVVMAPGSQDLRGCCKDLTP